MSEAVLCYWGRTVEYPEITDRKDKTILRKRETTIPSLPVRTATKSVARGTKATISDESIFDRKVAKWEEETLWQSSMSVITSHAAFAEIKSMGDRATVLILRNMEKGNVKMHWFPLLHDLSGGIDPTPPEDRGYIGKMTDAWVEWGKRAGKI